MNRLLTVCAVLAIAGCTNTNQLNEITVKLSESEKRIVELERRVARVEKDLYQIDVKAAPTVSLPKFNPVKELEPTTQEVKIKAFIKEHLEAEFGDPNTKYPNLIPDASGWVDLARVIPVVKKFGYFDKAYGFFEDGKLYSVSLYMEVDKKYSRDSVKLQYEQTVADILATVGVDPLRLKGRECYIGNIMIDKSSGMHDTNKAWRMCLSFRNNNLRSKYEKEKWARKNAQGEVLPAVKRD